MAQINYVSRNQLHCTANLNFGLMCKKAKHCWALSTNFLFLFSWYFFLIMFCFLLNWRKNSNYFKIAVWQSDSTKRNFRGFIFTDTSYLFCRRLLRPAYNTFLKTGFKYQNVVISGIRRTHEIYEIINSDTCQSQFTLYTSMWDTL